MKFTGRYSRVEVEPEEFDIDHYLQNEVDELKEKINTIQFDCGQDYKSVLKAMATELIENL